MTVVKCPDGYELRPIDDDDTRWLWESLRDWPVPGDSSPMFPFDVCRAQVAYSMDRITGSRLINRRSWNGVWWVLWSPADERLGAVRCSFLRETEEGPTGFDVDYAVVHPSHRGQGHYTRLESAIAWLANQHLAADAASMHVISGAPQVSHRNSSRGATVVEEVPAAVPGMTRRKEQMERSAVAERWSATDLASYALEVDGAVVAPSAK